MSSTIDGVRIVDMPDLGAFNSTSSLVGERAGSGRFSASGLTNYLTTLYLPLATGGTLGGPLTLAADPATALQAATKQYVDARIYQVATIAALRALTTVPANTVWVQGYRSVADGGEGTFCYLSSDTTSADNGGTIIADASGHRWFRETQSQPTSVKWFGAVGDNIADDTSEFQALLTYVASNGGGKMYIPSGNYKITGGLSYPAGYLHIEGAGQKSAIQFGSTTANLFTFTGTAITLSDFRVATPYQVSTDGTLFNFTNASNIRLSRINTDGGWDIVSFGGTAGTLSYRTEINNCHFINVMANGVFYDPYCGGLGVISDTEMLGAGSANNGNGIIVEGGDTFTWSNVNIQGFDFGVEVTSRPGGINYVGPIHATNVLCDNGGATGTFDGWLFEGGTGGTYVTRVRLTNCWGLGGRHGFWVKNASDVTLINCIAIANGQHGFLISNPSSDFTLTGCTANANSASASGTYDGIRVVGPVTDFIITGCRSKPNVGYGAGAGTNSQGYGITVDGTVNDRYVVSNNNLHGNVTGGLSDSSTGSPTRFVSQNIT